MPPSLIITSLVNTIQAGSMYALMAIGITLTMRVIKLPNFAHAEYITAGAFTALIMSMNVTKNPLIIFATAFVVGALVALVSHLIVFRPLEKQNASFYSMLLASFAVGLIIRYILFQLLINYTTNLDFNQINLRM